MMRTQVQVPHPTKEVQVYIPSKAIKSVQSQGFAKNYGSFLNSPMILTVGGSKAIPNDDNAADRRRIERTGLVDENGRPCDLYVTMWNKRYVLEGTPISGVVDTTGVPDRFK